MDKNTSGSIDRTLVKNGRYVFGVLSGSSFLPRLNVSILQCTTKDNHLVAHYDFRSSHMRYFGASGNSLVIYEAHANIAAGVYCCPEQAPRGSLTGIYFIRAEIVATCLIMRHIASLRFGPPL